MKNIHLWSVGGYLAAGVIVALWTVNRASNNKPAFKGLGTADSPTTVLAEAVLLWPWAALKNIIPPAK